MASAVFDIENMPRGGPAASRLDRWLQTDRLEYLDRDDVDHLKRRVVRFLDRGGRLFGEHKKFARTALDEVADVADPQILELGAGHGRLAEALLKMHPTAHVTVSDVDPTSVATIAAGYLGSHPRATVREMDATAIDAPDGFYDLTVFALSLHHLRPTRASQVFAEGTRAADKLLMIDLLRPPPLRHILELALKLPLTPLIPGVHDGFISSLRAYSPPALLALARHADPAITVELRGAFGRQIVLARRLRSCR